MKNYQIGWKITKFDEKLPNSMNSLPKWINNYLIFGNEFKEQKLEMIDEKLPNSMKNYKITLNSIDRQSLRKVLGGGGRN